MLKEGIGFKKIVVRCGRTDMRRGITGLVTIIRLEYGMDNSVSLNSNMVNVEGGAFLDRYYDSIIYAKIR